MPRRLLRSDVENATPDVVILWPVDCGNVAADGTGGEKILVERTPVCPKTRVAGTGRIEDALAGLRRLGIRVKPTSLARRPRPSKRRDRVSPVPVVIRHIDGV